MTTTKSTNTTVSQTQHCFWVVGAGADAVPVGQQIGGHYEVVAPQIWQDLTPEHPPQSPQPVPEEALPYLKAHAYRVHVPGVYDVVAQPHGAPWLLLESAPVNGRTRQLYPSLSARWAAASTTRQLSWLWQIWELWAPLVELGVAHSLLELDNLRVEGWRVRLLQLLPSAEPPALKDLARSWRPLVTATPSSIAPALENLCNTALTGEMSSEHFATDLNYLLLKEAAQSRYQFQIAGATHRGPKRPRNEDACYPEGASPESPTPRLAIVCDGVGGHEAGEVASHTALQALRLQLQGLIAEFNDEDDILPPAIVKQQLEAAIRVVNDLVNTQNDSQSRNDRQRMGTTLVVAVMIPQRLQTPHGWLQVDELYIAHVGDSRAYWITPDYCHQLTVDDDIARRDTEAGRSLYPSLRELPAAGALTQAIGTRNSTYLKPNIQRFVIDEEGVLLLCSDGLSDNQRIESAWANYIGLIIKDIVSLPSAVDAWVELANQKNGHDNVSVVLMQARPFAADAYESVESAAETEADSPQNELTDASKALLYSDEELGTEETTAPPAASEPTPQSLAVPRWWVATIAVLIVALAGILGWWIAGQLAPSSPSQNNNRESTQ